MMKKILVLMVAVFAMSLTARAQKKITKEQFKKEYAELKELMERNMAFKANSRRELAEAEAAKAKLEAAGAEAEVIFYHYIDD